MAVFKEMLMMMMMMTTLMMEILSDGKSPRHAGLLDNESAVSVFLRYVAVQACEVRVMPKDGNLSEYLWQSTQTEQLESLNSTFIQGLKWGTLDPTIFGSYLVQNCIFCYKVKHIIDIAGYKTKDDELRKMLEGRSASWERYYKKLFATWHIGDPSGIVLNDAYTEYIALLKDVAENMNSTYLVVALIPCAKLWPWIGKEISDSPHNFGVYESWVKDNLNSGSVSYRRLDNAINDRSILIDRIKALSIYRNCMQAETNCFKSVSSYL